MTFEEAIADLERGRVVVDGAKEAIAPTGEPYIEFCSGYTPDNGKEAIFLTGEAAIADWHRRVMAYAKDRPGTLYYRIRPEFDASERKVGYVGERPDGEMTCWLVFGNQHAAYSRLLISDKPLKS